MRAAGLLLISIACASPRSSASARAHAGYLSQIKEEVGRVWTPRVIDAAKANDPTGCLYSTTDRRTVVEFTLAADGDRTRLHVASSSGVAYLDRVAVDAFRSIGVLPPPPAGMIAGNTRSVQLPFSFRLQAAKAWCPAKKVDEPP